MDPNVGRATDASRAILLLVGRSGVDDGHFADHPNPHFATCRLEIDVGLAICVRKEARSESEPSGLL
jgi:hypothetical protein